MDIAAVVYLSEAQNPMPPLNTVYMFTVCMLIHTVRMS
jgi:hypothetical protein